MNPKKNPLLKLTGLLVTLAVVIAVVILVLYY